MNYKVLYRKYRPTSFNDVVGQNNAIALIKDSIINDKISHAYIFSGPRGTGKTSTAKIFAKTINCLDVKDGLPCNKCENCLNFTLNSDIYEIDAASNNGVDQVREIIDNIKLAPINSKYKVYIIDEVHMLSTSAFNALLLTLEEPPSHVVFILATTDIEDVPITVLSRCQRLDFQKISNKDIVDNMRKIANIENIDIEDAALEEIADYADGGMRDALSVLDQLSKTNTKITQNDVLDSLGSVSNKQITEVVEAIEKNNAEAIINFVKFTKTNSLDFKSICKRLIRCLEKRAIAIKLNDYNGPLSYDTIKNVCFEISSCIYKYNVNLDPYSMLELILLSYIGSNNNGKNISREIDFKEKENTWEIIKNEENDENKSNSKDLGNNEQETNDIKIDKSLPANLYVTKEFIDVRINNCFVSANKKFLTDAKMIWSKFIQLTKSKKERGFLLDTDIVLASDKILVIKTDIDATADDINEKIMDVENSFNSYASSEFKLIAVSENLWHNYMNEFKSNLQNGIKYTYKEEPKLEKKGQEIVEDIFKSDKIEIK